MTISISTGRCSFIYHKVEVHSTEGTGDSWEELTCMAMLCVVVAGHERLTKLSTSLWTVTTTFICRAFRAGAWQLGQDSTDGLIALTAAGPEG